MCFKKSPRTRDEIGPKYFLVAVAKDGSVWSFGDNVCGQLGLGHTNAESAPKRVNLSDIVASACGTEHSIFLDKHGKLFACGRNSSGCLGVGDYENKSLPTPVAVDALIDHVLCGNMFSMFVDNERRLWVTGSNTMGELGLGRDYQRINAPQLIPELNVLSISCSSDQVLCVNENNELLGWGSKYANVCLNGAGSFTPKKIQDNALSVAVGGTSVFIQTLEGQIQCWGNNEFGQLGVGDLEHRETPVPNPNLNVNMFPVIHSKKSARKTEP